MGQKKREELEGRPGGLAQLARASALQAEGHRFDSDILHPERPERREVVQTGAARGR